MKKSYLWLIVFFVLLSTYTPKIDYNLHKKFRIKKLIIEKNNIIKSEEIKKKLNFVYQKNLFFLDTHAIEKKIKEINFIEGFAVKKVYPATLKLVIQETNPNANLRAQKKAFYITDNGELIDFRDLNIFSSLPEVYGKSSDFYSLYKDLKKINFSINEIKSFYFFESGRWDLVLYNDKVIKLPIKNYLPSLKKFMKLKNDNSFNKYNTFDYRIKDQLILN